MGWHKVTPYAKKAICTRIIKKRYERSEINVLGALDLLVFTDDIKKLIMLNKKVYDDR